MEILFLSFAQYIISPLFILLILGGIIGFGTFLFLLRYKERPGVKYWLVWQIATAFWAISYAFEYGAIDLETKILWSKFSYFGIVYCALAFFLFSQAFFANNKSLNKKITIGLFSLATIFLTFPFTNDIHHLHWKSYAINPTTNTIHYEYGPLFWVVFGFSYITLFSGIINISRLYFKLSNFNRKRITLLFIASLLPPFGNIIYVFHINPIEGFDWTPFTFLFTGILIAINISRFKMFKLVPFARNKLIDIMPEAVLIVDNSYLIADYNTSFKKIMNLGDKDIVGMNIKDLVPHRAELIDTIFKHGDYKTELSREINGELRYFDFQATCIYNGNKERTGVLVMLKDTTHHVLAEQKINEANIRLTQEIKEKERLIDDLDAFSHTVAHDLKNLLSAMAGVSELIKTDFETLGKESLIELNDIINISATKSIHITTELLTLASVRQEKINPQPVEMKNIVSGAVIRLKDMIEKSSAKLIIPDTFPKVLGYETWLEEIWINHISNAIKYGGSPPEIEFGWEILNDQKCKFWIKDNGKGISADEIKVLYTKFTRLDAHKRIEGNGLGLSIVKRIVEKLNGEVGVDSTNIPGEGSTFYFILPKAE